MDINQIMASLEAKHPGELEYLQAVKEVLHSIEDIYNQHPEFEKASLIERLVEPDRIFTFKVPWVDDKGKVQVNLGYRVQFNNAIGPYKGGIRFHASVNLSILKFLGFEQTFKNALTTLPMGIGFVLRLHPLVFNQLLLVDLAICNPSIVHTLLRLVEKKTRHITRVNLVVGSTRNHDITLRICKAIHRCSRRGVTQKVPTTTLAVVLHKVVLSLQRRLDARILSTRAGD